MSKYGIFSSPYFPTFGLEKNSVFGHFSRSVYSYNSSIDIKATKSYYWNKLEKASSADHNKSAEFYQLFANKNVVARRLMGKSCSGKF